MSVSDLERTAPEAGEEIHLPGPTAIPFVMAIGITLGVIGTTISWYISIVGVVIFLICLYRWIKDTRRDIEALPEEHH
jgi:chromate transport protein ChrA